MTKQEEARAVIEAMTLQCWRCGDRDFVPATLGHWQKSHADAIVTAAYLAWYDRQPIDEYVQCAACGALLHRELNMHPLNVYHLRN